MAPPDDECRAEHSERIHHLVEAGVDRLLIETMNSIREAVIAAQLAAITGRPTWVSFVCDCEGRILSGESVRHPTRGRTTRELRTRLLCRDQDSGCRETGGIVQPVLVRLEKDASGYF